ncbi:MAG: pyrroloquinoline quinone biosynthesis protein PqqB [Variibacter sp.]
MNAIVLGAAAGGGFPQWNCRCRACQMAWAGDIRVKPRTQASLAVSGDGAHWTLINATPDLRAQIKATRVLHPRALRDTPITSVVLTGAEVDQVAGLLDLRERQAFSLYGSRQTLDTLRANPIFDVLAADCVERREAALDRAITLPGDITIDLFAVPGKVPLYREASVASLKADEGETVGVDIRTNDRRLIYIPGAATLNAAIMARIAGADAVLFDGTLFTDEEMIRTGTGAKTGLRMGHMPIDGESGSLRALAEVSARRIYTHINNTNPILIADSAERRTVETAGWEIAEDGMEIVL